MPCTLILSFIPGPNPVLLFTVNINTKRRKHHKQLRLVATIPEVRGAQLHYDQQYSTLCAYTGTIHAQVHCTSNIEIDISTVDPIIRSLWSQYMYVVVKTPQPQSLHSSACRVAGFSHASSASIFRQGLGLHSKTPIGKCELRTNRTKPHCLVRIRSGVCPTVCCKATLVSLAEELLGTEW